MKKMTLTIAAVALAFSGSVFASGEQIYKTKCFACHSTGAAGAPKIGDKKAWAPRIAQGMDVLFQHAKNGFKAMPPKGTCMDCTDEQLKSAVEYIVSQSK